MADWQDDERLNATDKDILELLEAGRETRGSLVDNIGKHETTISPRLKWLREWGYVRYYHEPTGLYELADDQ
ncbi:winged helix-turn-helix domain-containing protein [Natrialba taiwanensis]|uniref:HTH arsR-type domain-containing protein n=1 Tax=Natrialba taiwanensis DSM 12281 TaxID=1230458 RepID=M0ADR3_9EURY|nr:winged helix-turn-helix domain-containing protein [Natrialba taiwanensis]ELY96521.1 hypothetical protein C484_00810 [Natrialba taiwanensis DSM 12281]